MFCEKKTTPFKEETVGEIIWSTVKNMHNWWKAPRFYLNWKFHGSSEAKSRKEGDNKMIFILKNWWKNLDTFTLYHIINIEWKPLGPKVFKSTILQTLGDNVNYSQLSSSSLFLDERGEKGVTGHLNFNLRWLRHNPQNPLSPR